MLLKKEEEGIIHIYTQEYKRVPSSSNHGCARLVEAHVCDWSGEASDNSIGPAVGKGVHLDGI